jgi:hypothetical protein
LSGRFIGFLPKHIAVPWEAQRLMRLLKPQAYGFESQHFIATRASDAERPLVRLLVQEIRQQAVRLDPVA